MPDNTNAERQARFRARRLQEIARLKARIAELEAARQKREASGSRRQSAQATDMITALEREIIGLKFKLAEARDRAADGEPSDEVLRLQHENASLRRQLALSRASAKPRPPPPPPSEQEAKLRAKIRELRTQLREVARTDQRTVLMSAADRRALIDCLHPDRAQGDPVLQRRLTKALQIFNNLKIHVIKSEE